MLVSPEVNQVVMGTHGSFRSRMLLITILVTLGLGLGTIYVLVAGGGEIQVMKGEFVGDGLPTTDDERERLEAQAIEVALGDERVKELIEGRQYELESTFYSTWQMETVSKDPGVETFKFVWDGKLRAMVTIVYEDDSGYFIHVNITDMTVESLKYIEQIPSRTHDLPR